jgi:hypothetical protein
MRPNILLCCTGSIATLKVPQLAIQLSEWANVLVICTPSALHFLERAREYHPESWDFFQQNIRILVDSDEWYMFSGVTKYS